MDLQIIEHYKIGSKHRNEIAVLVTTEKRAFACWVDLRLFDGAANCLYYARSLRNAIRWGDLVGVADLSLKGPGKGSRLDNASDAYVVTQVRCIRPLSENAIDVWGI